MSEYTLEELQQMLNESEDIPLAQSDEKDLPSSIIKFISENNIISSVENRVPSYHIYIQYKNRFKQGLKPIAFFRTFKQLFDQHRTKHQRYYKIEADFDMTMEALRVSEVKYRRRYGRQKAIETIKE